MTTAPHTPHQPRGFALGRLRAFLAVLALTALAITSTHADVIFTRSTTTGEGWAAYSATFTPTQSGAYTLGFSQTAGGPSGDNSILIDAVRVTQGSTTLFSDGFENPAVATNNSVHANGGTATFGAWTFFTYSGILDGSPPNWGLAGQGLGTADGTTQYAFIQAAGGQLSKFRTANTLSLVAGQTYTVSFYQASRRDFGGTTTYTVSLDYVPPTVYASGLSTVIAWDPIFPSAPVNPDSNEAKPAPTVGYDDPRWTNPHNATVFPKNSHVWEYQSWVPSAFKFDANWINAWPNLNSNGHGQTSSSPAWANYPYYRVPHQSWTKYSTIIEGSGSFVLQFFADNASWIYLDGELVGYQDYNWPTNGTGRYTINLTGEGQHELAFIIWDGGGLAGGKFRIETVQSFVANNPGVPLPPPPPADTTAPVIAAPGSITTEATGPLGATVTFNATATDNTDGPVPVTASPASGSVFPLGTTAVGLAASDAAGNTATASFGVTVRDTTAPAIAAATNVGPIEATGPGGATVAFAVPVANDLVDGVRPVSAAPASGSLFPLGSTTVSLASSDTRGNTSSRTFSVTVADTTAPTITAPANLTAEATSAAGATVSYEASANDLVDGSVAVTGSPASGSTFALGTTNVTLTATDTRGNGASASFSVTVQDTTAPALTLPADQTLEATGPTGAVASFAASATDAVGVTALTSSPASGSMFALGTTSVTVTATDAAGNSASGSFHIVVQDTTAPAISTPVDLVAEATSADGAVVAYSASAEDLVDGSVAVTGAPASGSTFPLGTTAVVLTSTDRQGNSSTATFHVTVRDTIAPTLTVPADQVLEATGPAGAAATFAASGTDAVGVTELNSSHASGSTFALGTTTVTVSARDAAGNTTTGSFTITVRDTTAPALTVPANLVLEATGASGAVASFAATATDAVGVTALNYSTAPGSTFALGTTTVTVTAQDAAGNTTTGSFTVTVRDTTAPVISSLSNTAPTLWPPNHKMVAVTVRATAADVVGVTSLKIIGVTSSEPDNGLGDGDTANDIQITGALTVNLRAERSGKGNGRTYTITVEARDAAGNVTTQTTTAFVPKSQGK